MWKTSDANTAQLCPTFQIDRTTEPVLHILHGGTMKRYISFDFRTKRS